MRYSWTKFAIGVLAGIVGIWLLFYDWSYGLLSVLLLVLSVTFTTQAPRAAAAAEPDTFTSDAAEWRKEGRGCIEELPRIALWSGATIAFFYAQDFAFARWPVLDRPPASLTLIVLSAVWLVRMVFAFRAGRHRNELLGSRDSAGLV